MKTCTRMAWILWVLAVSTGLVAQGIVWFEKPGLARDITVGGPSTFTQQVIYMIGKETVDSRYGGAICRWNYALNDWEKLGGLADAVTVTPAGVPWVVNCEGKIYEMVNSRWVERPGDFNQRMRARDIGVGMNGIVHIIGRNNDAIYKWNGSTWMVKSAFGRGAVRIDVDLNGNPWVVNNENSIYRYDRGRWLNMTSGQGIGAFDVGTDISGWEVWITRMEFLPEGGRLYYTTADSSGYWYGSKLPPEQCMQGVRIDVQQGVIWLVSASGRIFQGIMD